MSDIADTLKGMAEGRVYMRSGLNRTVPASTLILGHNRIRELEDAIRAGAPHLCADLGIEREDG